MAQYSTDGFDSIAIEKIQETSLDFTVHHKLIQSAKLSPGIIFDHSEPGKKRKGLRQFDLPCRLSFNDNSDMEILLYGKWEKIKSFGIGKSDKAGDNSDFRITNDVYHTWEKGMTADLVSGYDTVGQLTVSTNPFNDTAYRKWLVPAYIEQGMNPPDPNPKMHDNMHRSFGFIGVYKSRQVQMVYWGGGRKGWIFQDTILLAMWRSDNDHLNTTQRAKTSKRWPPYLLVKPGLSAEEQVDILRIAFTGRFIAEALKPGIFF